jgi:hypothetical protein
MQYFPLKRRQICMRLLGLTSHQTAILFYFGLRESYTYAIINLRPHHEGSFLTSAEDRSKWPFVAPIAILRGKSTPISHSTRLHSLPGRGV